MDGFADEANEDKQMMWLKTTMGLACSLVLAAFVWAAQLKEATEVATAVVHGTANSAPVLLLDYSVLSYARIKLAGNTYTGANVRLFHGSAKAGGEFSLRAMPIVGLRLLSVANHIPIFFEVEFFGDRRPVKAALILTWE